MLRADSGGRGPCGKNRRIFLFLSWRMRSVPRHPSSSTEPSPPSAHAHSDGRRVHGHQGSRQCAQQRTPRPVALSESSLSTTHFQNHGRSDSSFSRTANHRLVHLPRAAAGEYMPGLWMGEGTRSAPGPKVPQWYYLSPPVRVRAHILAQTLSPVRPRPAGNKDSGVRRSPAADDHDQCGKNRQLYSNSTPGGRRGTLCSETLELAQRKFLP